MKLFNIDENFDLSEQLRNQAKLAIISGQDSLSIDVNFESFCIAEDKLGTKADYHSVVYPDGTAVPALRLTVGGLPVYLVRKVA